MLEQTHGLKSRQGQHPRMPIDKQSSGKPITPALSSNFRSTKSPLTPRLAGSAPGSPAIGVGRDPFNRTRSPVREETTTPSANGNITPHTAARRSRIGTESPSTPSSTGTATAVRPRAISGAASRLSTRTQPGLGISSPLNSTDGIQTQAKMSTPLVPYRRVSGARSAAPTASEGDSKFFRADDAKPSVESPGPTRPALNRDNSSFFFVGSANGVQPGSPRISPSRADEKFFHASDARVQSKTVDRPDLRSKNSTPSQINSRPRSVVGRSPSPPKRPLGRPERQATQSEDVASTKSPLLARQAVDRRGSVGSDLSNLRLDHQTGHRKPMSADSLNTTPTKKAGSPNSLSITTLDERLAAAQVNLHGSVDSSVPQSTSPENSSPRNLSFGSSRTASITEARPSHSSHKRLSSVTAPVGSPQLAPSSLPQPQPPQSPHKDAANARRERKVLDLEISNSSLLAINKTLEKELKKQNSELRTFRRLSRSGRLSLAPTDRSISASSLDPVAEGSDSDDSENDKDSDIGTVDEDDILSNDSSSVQSPTSRAKQRARDEKRLILDLSKHQQMLIDSQRLTQSIRRCLTCTEELIRDGNKALQYRVGIGDVKLGGRVLNHDEFEVDQSANGSDEPPRRQGLLSPSLTTATMTDANYWDRREPQQVDSVLDPDLASPTALQDCLELLSVTKT